MTIRTRLTCWYAGILFVSLLTMGVLTYQTFAPETTREDPRKVAEDESDFQEVLRILLWCGVPASLLALGGGWWLMCQALKPVSTLTQAAERITEQNLHEQLPRTGSGDELDRLTSVFNGMLARLNGSFSRIREFTLHASHELKTPLTILRGQIETALVEDTLTPPQRELFASQLDELSRLTRIVDGLTLLAKADAGLVTLELAPVRFDELVRDNFADAQILAHAAGVQVKLDACDVLSVNGDPHRLRQLLLNLADNAIKYNQPQGRVTIALHRAGDTAEFVITNSGPGIPSDALPRVFDRFFRGDPAHNSSVEGCGLGLSIAQWIVSAHKGTIQIESVPAVLTTIKVFLPLAAPNQHPA